MTEPFHSSGSTCPASLVSFSFGCLYHSLVYLNSSTCFIKSPNTLVSACFNQSPTHFSNFWIFYPITNLSHMNVFYPIAKRLPFFFKKKRKRKKSINCFCSNLHGGNSFDTPNGVWKFGLLKGFEGLFGLLFWVITYPFAGFAFKP